MANFETDREGATNDLAERLFFELEKRGNHYSLCRKIGCDEVERLLERWKLEGPHGG